MLKWFKRRSAPADEADSTLPLRPPSRPAGPGSGREQPAPLPEVVSEGNTQADWSAWEDSMTALDSQMQDLMPSARVYVREPRPSQLDELDPFANVGRKRDV